MNSFSSFRSKRAFTLIELLIVITIIGILAVALLPRITSGPGKARDAQRKADLQQIATALALYADDNSGSYPSTAGCVGNSSGTIGTLIANYLTSVPTDPKSNNAVGTACSSGYAYWPTKDGFLLGAALETSTTFGTSIYDVKSVTTTTVSSTSTTSSILSGSSLTACSSAACTGTPGYILGR